MSIRRKSIATTISMVILVLSLTAVSSTTALGRGNKRPRITGASVTGRRLAIKRSAASGARHSKGAIILADQDFKATVRKPKR